MEAFQAHVNVMRNNQGMDLLTEHNVKKKVDGIQRKSVQEGRVR